ncbi:MAG: hypothetical protein ACE1Y2_08210, partial [Stenotrophomonas maltophilia]
ALPISPLPGRLPGRLKDNAIILLELDPEQVPAVKEMADRLFPGAETSTEPDISQRDRLFVINRGQTLSP